MCDPRQASGGLWSRDALESGQGDSGRIAAPVALGAMAFERLWGLCLPGSGLRIFRLQWRCGTGEGASPSAPESVQE